MEGIRFMTTHWLEGAGDKKGVCVWEREGVREITGGFNKREKVRFNCVGIKTVTFLTIQLMYHIENT